MKRSLFGFLFLSTFLFANAQKSSIGVTFGGALNLDKEYPIPTDFYFSPNMQLGITGKTLFFDRLVLEASVLYGIRQLNVIAPIVQGGNFNDQCYSSTIAISPVVGVRLFEVGIHNLNIGIGAEPTVYLPHGSKGIPIVESKNRFDVPVLAKLTYGVSGVDIALTYKHSFKNQYNIANDHQRVREIMLSVYLPIFKK